MLPTQDPSNKAREEVRSQSAYYISQVSDKGRSFGTVFSFIVFHLFVEAESRMYIYKVDSLSSVSSEK